MSFECEGDSQCSRFGDGRCEAGNCIYPDETCLLGERYSRFAAPSLANSCVAAETATGEPGSSGSTSNATAVDVSTGTDESGWWDCAWKQRARVTFAGDAGPALADFTVLVTIYHAGLAGSFAEGGADIRFIDDDGTTVLDHELEHFDRDGISLAWVRVPELRTGSDDAIHLYWDNPAATALEATAAWDEHHVGVWHLGDDVRDSTPTGADGSDDSNGPVPGRIGDGRDFLRGMSTSINVGSPAPLDDAFAGGGTVLAWARVDSFAGGEVSRIAGKTMTDPAHSGWKLFVVGEAVEAGASRNTLGFHRTYDANPSEWQGPTDAVPSDGTWHLLGATFCDDLADCQSVCADDCSGDDCFSGDAPVPRLFLDGAPTLTLVTRMVGGAPVSDADDQLVIGRGPFEAEGFDGVIDELRVARTVRCDSWMRAEYQSMTGDLALLGPPQASTCP